MANEFAPRSYEELLNEKMCIRDRPGIRAVTAALEQGKILIGEGCRAAIREFSLYRWDESGKKDQVVKAFDHAMDDIRYFVMYAVERPSQGFFALAAERP